MPEKRYNCQEINLTHPRMIELHKSGHLELGTNDDFAALITNEIGLGTTKLYSKCSFHFWDWAAVGILGCSVYSRACSVVS